MGGREDSRSGGKGADEGYGGLMRSDGGGGGSAGKVDGNEDETMETYPARAEGGAREERDHR